MLDHPWPRRTAATPSPLIISKVTPRSQNMDPKYFLLSEKRNAVRKNPQQILVFCTLGRSPDPRGTGHRRVCRRYAYATVENTYIYTVYIYIYILKTYVRVCA
jgi:hypothetical protein